MRLQVGIARRDACFLDDYERLAELLVADRQRDAVAAGRGMWSLDEAQLIVVMRADLVRIRIAQVPDEAIPAGIRGDA